MLKVKVIVLLVCFFILFTSGSAYGGEIPKILVKYKNNFNMPVTYSTSTVQDKGLQAFGIVGINPHKGESISKACERLRKDPEVEFAEPNYIYKAANTSPNDTYYSRQWSLKKLNFPAAWDLTLGSNDVVIAVVDSGIDLDHPELVDRLVSGANMTGTAPPEDQNGHGTAVAGIIAAATNNASGVAASTWRGRIMPVKVLDHTGSGYASDIAAGIKYAVDNGAQIINLSLGGDDVSLTIQEAIDYAVENGVTVVAAAGNENKQVSFPASYEPVISVGAIDRYDVRASFSNYGPSLDVVAPGEDVWVLEPSFTEPTVMDGTSFAAPYVSGAISLLLSLEHNISPYEIESLLKQTSIDLGDFGRDNYYGNGLINVFDLLINRPGAPSLTGNIDLEGAASPDMARIQLKGEAIDWTENPESLGGFSFKGYLPGKYQLIITAPAHLQQNISVQLSDSSINFQPIKLKYGDINQDKKINLFDLVNISVQLDQQSELLDVDHDGLVTKVELQKASSNYCQ